MATIDLEEAIEGISRIRRGIESACPSSDALRAQRTLLTLAAAGAGSLLSVECLGRNVTAALHRSEVDHSLRMQGVMTIGLAIFLAIAIVSCVLSIYASRADRPARAFVDSHLPHLSLLGFGSDLFLKYCAVGAVILALKPDFVAPLLLVSIADYLLQGRFFSLPLWLRVAGALCAVSIAAGQFWFGDGAVWIPLAFFTIFSACSVLDISRQERSAAI